MDINQIRELVRVAEESGVGEIVVEEEGMRIAVRMPSAVAAPVAAPNAAPAAAQAAAPAAAPVAQPVAAASPAPANTPAPAAASADIPQNWYAVSAPMVGTYYAAPSPGAAPFVQVGDEVTANQTLCIVEAMKLMNEIGAPEMGIVRKICLNDGDPVEYGTPLFYLEPISSGAGAAPECA